MPAGEGEQLQSTEATVGPYALQDFTLFHVLRYGFRPTKIAFLAWHAWHDVGRRGVAARVPGDRPAGVRPAGDPALAGGVLQRFFAFSQFKRSALPNGPKVSAGGSLSPRGDWRAPSDMSARIWLDELQSIPELEPSGGIEPGPGRLTA